MKNSISIKELVGLFEAEVSTNIELYDEDGNSVLTVSTWGLEGFLRTFRIDDIYVNDIMVLNPSVIAADIVSVVHEEDTCSEE